jgi:hypothetical protein
LDPELVEEMVVRHSSDIWLLAPPPPEFAERVRAEKFALLLDYLKNATPTLLLTHLAL